MTTDGAAVDRERWAGIIFTFLSTIFYCISNVVIRFLTGFDEIEHSWILFYKEGIGVAILLPWLLLRWGQGRFRSVSIRLVLLIIIAAIVCQLIGAQLHVLGFAIIGLIITVPLVQAATLLGVAIVGYMVFGDSLSRGRKIAIATLIVAMTILSIGKALAAEPQDESEVSADIFLLVAAGVVVAGFAYGIYIVMMRYAMRQEWRDDNRVGLSFKFRHWVGHDNETGAPFPVTLAIVIVLSVGMVIFGTVLCSKQGIAGFYTVPGFAWQFMLISGVCNTIGFFFQLQGLRMTSAVQASLIAVSQMLLLSLIGYWFFAEAINVVMMLGLGLTVYGVVMSARPER